ncbi:MAG: hypothetical protein KKB53_06465 [Acidobacteria bacterium]|nr:hypothetical protein [Acidobacteriota bacterium]MBU4330131.1 hypothetical protein [Acidobacteriota bacterium]
MRKMSLKSILSMPAIMYLAFLLYPQETLIETSLVLNIEVPVRVFNGGKFVDNLKIKDFELWEDGIKQKIEAVYLIKKDTIHRKEEKKPLKPQTGRTFFLFFEVTDYLPRLGEAVEYFCENVLLDNDSLIAVTPLKTYRLKERGLQLKTRTEIANELRGLIKKDAVIGSSDYREAVKEMENLAKMLGAALAKDPDDPSQKLGATDSLMGKEGWIENVGIEGIINMYRTYLQKLDTMRKVDELRFLDFAKYLKEMDGQKHVFLFYQREFIPQVEPRLIMQNLSAFQDTAGDISHVMAEITDLYKRDVPIDTDRVKQAFADSSSAVHFLFITKPRPNVPGVYFAEQSNDIFAPFMDMAKATGGIADSSANAKALFQNALAATENYYLLYYTPKNYKPDETFKRIDVKVNGKKYRISHRAGYFAN